MGDNCKEENVPFKGYPHPHNRESGAAQARVVESLLTKYLAEVEKE